MPPQMSVFGGLVLMWAERMVGAIFASQLISIGTTLPEVMVSTNSALGGHGEIA